MSGAGEVAAAAAARVDAGSSDGLTEDKLWVADETKNARHRHSYDLLHPKNVPFGMQLGLLVGAFVQQEEGSTR